MATVELSERFSISRKTAHKGINRYEEFGANGFAELSRRPHVSPAQTPAIVSEELVKLRTKHPHWGPRKLLHIMGERHPDWLLPAESTANRKLRRAGMVRVRRIFTPLAAEHSHVRSKERTCKRSRTKG